ncbi:tyrosine-type recombinase/integrase [Cupriavidus sp. P-10]|uniref:tyrosine-type recombinase/integrase n=2 Tax=Burkholderiaceae TaxID=119060 RepID=UPI001F43A863|nr:MULTISPECIES: tyrosine-type recombinase/integrase [Cupriavidus]
MLSTGVAAHRRGYDVTSSSGGAAAATPHPLRNTFLATHAVANDVPTDVLQRLLDHASLQTTSLYVPSERKRTLHEIAKLFESHT